MKISGLYITSVAVLAVLVGLFYAGPQFLIGQELARVGYRYTASPFVDLADGGDSYFQFARQIYEGRFPPGDLFSGTDRQLPNIYPWLPPLLLGGLVTIFKDVSWAYLAANFVFSVILFILFYILGMIVLKRNRLWSLLLGLVGVLTPLAGNMSEMFFSPANFGNIFLKNFYPAVKTYLPLQFLSRVDHPLLTYPIYLLAIIAVVLFWYKPTRLRAIAAGFSSALLFYTYFHMWVYWLIVLGVLFVLNIFFFKKDKQRLKGFVILGTTMTLAAVPYFINFFQFKSWPGSQDLIQRLGVELGRSFNTGAGPYYLVYMAVGLLVWKLYGRGDIHKMVLYLSFLLAAFIVWNIQVVTGFVPHSDHWPRVINPLVLLIVFDIVFSLFVRVQSRRSVFKMIISGFVMLAVVLLISKKFVNLTIFISSPPPVLERHVLPQYSLSSFDWLEKHNPDKVVISPSFLTSIYLAGFTSTRSFLPWGGVTAMSNTEIENRFLIANKLFDVSEETLARRLSDGRDLVCSYDCGKVYSGYNLYDTRLSLYQLYFADQGQKDIPQAKIEELTQKYRGLNLKNITLPISPSKLIYAGPWEREFSGRIFGSRDGYKLLFKNSQVEIYE